MKAIFHEDFNFTRKGEGVHFRVQADEKPQTKPADVIEAAIAAGAAKEFAPKKKPKSSSKKD